MMGSKLQLFLFGGLQIVENGVSLANFMSNKVPALFIYLALTKRPHQRDSLAALLWSEMSDADAKNNLRQALSNLRKFLDPHLLVSRDTIAFNPKAAYTLDVEQFETQLQFSQTNPQNQIEALQQVANLYQGEFLAGFFVREAPDFEEWMLAQRARLRERALYALHTLTELYLEQGEYNHTIDVATQLLSIDSWREESHRHLMLALARRGQRSAALVQYESCRQLLRKELGIEPALETTVLYERILSAKNSLRHNLLLPPTPFVGREKELAQLYNYLAAPLPRLITLTGTGGIGKTRLAQQIALRCSEMFIHGVWFVSMASLAEDLEVNRLFYALAEALPMPAIGSANPQKQVGNFLQRKELLLVLDNVEHLHYLPDLLVTLLQIAPMVKVLATSRERLNLQSEWVYEIGGLEMPALTPTSLNEPTSPKLESFSAIQLFLQGARRVHAPFTLTSHNQTAVQEICQLVGGLPLGIELAAAWVYNLDCTQIAAEIGQNLAFLSSSQRDLPPRQRSLQAVFDSSWTRLSLTEQQLFAQLAVFQGGFTLAAAQKICGATLPILNVLVNKSLVSHELTGRYQLHPVLHQFAKQKLSALLAMRIKAQNQHAAYYAQQSAEQFLPRLHLRVGVEEMATELENLQLAGQWGMAEKNLLVLSQLLPVMMRFFYLKGRFREGEQFCAGILAQFPPTDHFNQLPPHESHKLSAWALMEQAAMLNDLGQKEQVEEMLQNSLSFFRQLGEPMLIVRCLNFLGTKSWANGQYEQSKTYFHEALALGERHAIHFELATTLNDLGVIALTLGNYAEAQERYASCLALREKLGDRAGTLSPLINMATALTNLGRISEAEQTLRQAIEICHEFGDQRRLAAALTNLGVATYHLGNLAQAKNYYQQALAVYREIGFQLGIVTALDNIGSVAYQMGDNQEAQTFLYRALLEAVESQFDFMILDILVWMAGLRWRTGNPIAALELLALPLYHPATDSETLPPAQKLLAEISATLPKPTAQAALSRGKTAQLFETAIALLDQM